MGFRALEGLDDSFSRTVKKKVKVQAPAPEPEPEIGEERPVRVPRVIPSTKIAKVEKLKESSSLVEANEPLGVQQQTVDRREQVMSWMLNGHLHEGELMSLTELADSLQVPIKTVERDVATLKEKMAEYHTEAANKDIPALAYMLLEMKFQDRGRALALYNIIMGDIKAADESTQELLERSDIKVKKGKITGLTGRDRAAMYSAALSALDLSNKATTGMDSLFKMTGGAQKLQQIIQAKLVQVNAGNGQVITMEDLQKFAAEQFRGVLPSTRVKGALPPTDLELSAEDLKVMEIK